MSTTTSACCTTAVRAACSKPSSGTAARPKPRANRCASSAPKTVKPWSNLWSPSDARHAHDPSPNPLCRRAGAAGRRPCPCPGSGCQHGHSLLQHGPRRAGAVRPMVLAPGRSEERRVGKGVDLGGRRIIKKKKKNNEKYISQHMKMSAESHQQSHANEIIVR